MLTVCLGKSNHARCGIIVNVTPFEPEWEGYVTLEFSNTTPLPAKIYAGEGCAQMLFFESDEGARPSYKDRGGKYQGQVGVTCPKFRKNSFTAETEAQIKSAISVPLCSVDGIQESLMRFHFSGHHHRRRLPFGKRLGSRYPPACRSDRKEGMEVLGVTSYGDLSLPSSSRAPRASSCRWTTRNWLTRPRKPLPSCAPSSRKSATKTPRSRFPCMAKRGTSRHIRTTSRQELHGFIHMFEDTPEFIARNVVREAKSYLDSLPPPFFRALVHYAADGRTRGTALAIPGGVVS